MQLMSMEEWREPICLAWLNAVDVLAAWLIKQGTETAGLHTGLALHLLVIK